MGSAQKSTLHRTACDYCRQQRLKCLRDEGDFQCHQCSRLGRACFMAEARRPERPPQTSRRDASPYAFGYHTIQSCKKYREPKSAVHSQPTVDLGTDPPDGNRFLNASMISNTHGDLYNLINSEENVNPPNLEIPRLFEATLNRECPDWETQP
ncbi:hypothetical protein BJ170DRAFT_308561 [Xylariales sp. AK1849]|nr:hypothetical protein BJ170DRAFT_308561 [Xylariales sp. AK1849]